MTNPFKVFQLGGGAKEAHIRNAGRGESIPKQKLVTICGHGEFVSKGVGMVPVTSFMGHTKQDLFLSEHFILCMLVARYTTKG
jgi:hypothetical protein